MTAIEPDGVDKEWYPGNFLYPSIDTIFKNEIINTAAGQKVKIFELIIPEVTMKVVKNQSEENKQPEDE